MAAKPSANAVRVESHRGARAYDPMIFGQFLEHFHRQVYGGVFEPGSPLADANGFRKDVIQAMKELHVPVVRWPGGCFVSAYHWEDGVGPSREPSYDKAWQVEDPNTFGTDEFVMWCRLIDAEPYICTNAGTGTPEEMSDWVEYCNLGSAGRRARLRQANGYDAPHNVKFWSVGNENYGFWEMGAKVQSEWGHFVAESAKMMRRVDPDIKLLAAASFHDMNWNLELLRKAGLYLDYISVHNYADRLNQIDAPKDYETCMTRVLLPEQIITLAEHVIAVAGYSGRVGIAFDEWNLRGWHHPVAEDGFSMDIAARDRNDANATYTMADAVYSACFLNSCLRHCDSVKMANMAPVINTRGPLFVYPEGIVKRTTFHVLAMYASHLQPNVVDVWVDCGPLDRPALTLQSMLWKIEGAAARRRLDPPEVQVPALDVIATCDDSKSQWCIAVVNRHAEKEITVEIGLGDSRLSGAIDAVVLAGTDADAYNDVKHPNRVVPDHLKQVFSDGCAVFPPHSVTILKTSQA